MKHDEPDSVAALTIEHAGGASAAHRSELALLTQLGDNWWRQHRARFDGDAQPWRLCIGVPSQNTAHDLCVFDDAATWQRARDAFAKGWLWLPAERGDGRSDLLSHDAHQWRLTLPRTPGAERDLREVSARWAASVALGFAPLDALCVARAADGAGWPAADEPWPQTDLPADATATQDAFARHDAAPGLYAIVPDARWVETCARWRVPLIQLRCKRGGTARLRAEIRTAIAAVAGTEARLYINDHWRLAIEAGAYGVHLGQEDLDGADLDAIRAAGLRLGVSTHGYYEMLRARALRPSYLAMGAIFPTATKAMPSAPQGLARLRAYLALLGDIPGVAIGGIDAQRLPLVGATGVRHVAVVRAITEAADPALMTAWFNAVLARRAADG